MGQDILKRLEKESPSLCLEAGFMAGDAWEITKYEKITDGVFRVVMNSRKRPGKTRRYTALLDKKCWCFMRH